MSNVKLSAVDKVFPSGELALYDVNFESAGQELLVVLGGEKSGKSTLLRVIAGLDYPSDGNIFVDGTDVTEAEPKDRNVAMVFRSNTLYPSLTVFENMAYGLRIRKAPKVLIDQRVKSAAKILGLEDVLYRKPKTLTSVQKQRVAIGRAIVREPKLYLFDEPLAGLDEKLKAEMLNLVVNLQARMSGTFIYATKNVDEAMSIATRVIVLKGGIVQQIDTPANLYDYPSNAYVAFEIGSPTINFVHKCAAAEADGKTVLSCGELKIPLSEGITKRFTAVKEYLGSEKRVLLGIRPEDIKADADGELEGVLGKVESDGKNTYAECKICGAEFIILVADGAKTGDSVKVRIDPDRIQLFDEDTRITLLERDGGYVKTPYAEADLKPLTFADEEEIRKKFKPEKQSKKRR